MTGNLNYPTPSPTMLALQAAKNDLETKDAAAQSRDKNDIAARNVSRLALVALLDLLANYVSFTANGNITIMQTSGFNLQHARTHVGELPVPENFTVSVGTNSGEINVRCKGVKHARSYVVQHTDTTLLPAGPWMTLTSGSGKVKVVGLTPAQQMAFRMAAVGSGTSLNFTDTISIFVS